MFTPFENSMINLYIVVGIIIIAFILLGILAKRSK
jgi:hypothetical protein